MWNSVFRSAACHDSSLSLSKGVQHIWKSGKINLWGLLWANNNSAKLLLSCYFCCGVSVLSSVVKWHFISLPSWFYFLPFPLITGNHCHTTTNVAMSAPVWLSSRTGKFYFSCFRHAFLLTISWSLDELWSQFSHFFLQEKCCSVPNSLSRRLD